MATVNRVAGDDLSSRKKPDIAILELENAVCLPDKTDHQRQRMNYAVLVSRIITTNLICLEFLQGVKENHIAHQYRNETSQPTETVCVITDLTLIKLNKGTAIISSALNEGLCMSLICFGFTIRECPSS